MEEVKENQDVVLPVSNSEMHTCKSCGNAFTGNYCNICGEKVLRSKDRTFKTFLKNFLEIFSIRNNKFIQTLWLVISRPGFLSKEYADGKTVNYFPPLQLFFILNLIYFLFPLLQLFNTSLHTQLYLRTHSGFVRRMVASKLVEENLSLQAYTLMYNEKSTSFAKLLIILFVLFASVPMIIIYRKRNRYFTDHVNLALELTSFNLAMNAIFLSFFLMALNKILHWTNLGWERYLNDLTLTIIFVLTNSYFLFAAGRIFYLQKGKILIIKVIAGLLGLFLALELYRLLLFLITYWSL